MRNEIIIGLLVFIISTPVGYLLNDYFTRDRLSIENVEVIPKIVKHKLNKKLIVNINNYQSKKNFTGSNYRLNNLPNEITKDQIKILLKTLSAEKSEAQVDLDAVETYLKKALLLKSDDDTRELVKSENNAPYSQYIFDPLTIKKSDLLSTLKYNSEDIKSYISTIDALISELTDYKEVRNGEFELSVTLLNSGNTDGLIKYEGFAFVKGYEQSIPILMKKGIIDGSFLPLEMQPLLSLFGELKTTAINKRSMTGLVFSIDSENVSSKIVKEIKELIKKGQPIDIKVHLKDFRGEDIQSKYFKLYATQ